MPEIDTSVTAGVEARGYRRGPNAGDGWDQYVVPVADRIESFRGRSSTFVTPGRPVAAQRLFAIHNATGSTTLVSINRVVVDLMTTVAKAIGNQPPVIRANRFTALPTGGTALVKVGLDSAQTSNASVTVWGDASADNAGAGTSSATALTITPNPTTSLAQVFAPRFIGTAGYEMVDTAAFFIGEPDVVLRPLEGVVISLTDPVTLALGNPATDKWIAFCDWTEYTKP
jgi:hypothetical protein